MYNREIEKKFVVSESYEYAAKLMRMLYPAEIEAGTSVDTFWTAPGVDFIRVRDNSKELTVKVSDKGTTTDRIEENVELRDTITVKRFLTLVHDNPTIRLTKEYIVLHGTDKSIISLYRVLEDNQERVFLEVEASTISIVDKVLNQFSERLTLSQETRSLFQIFAGDAK